MERPCSLVAPRSPSVARSLISHSAQPETHLFADYRSLRGRLSRFTPLFGDTCGSDRRVDRRGWLRNHPGAAWLPGQASRTTAHDAVVPRRGAWDAPWRSIADGAPEGDRGPAIAAELPTRRLTTALHASPRPSTKPAQKP